MKEIAGLTPTGREVRDPAATIVELLSESGAKHLAIDFDDRFVAHESLALNVDLVLSFLQYPMVVGLVELSHHDLEGGIFAYPTGEVLTLKEVTRTYQDLAQVIGVRAGLELLWAGTQVLAEAGESGPLQGCFSHGNINPWRICLRKDGQVQIIGHGLANVELQTHLADPSFPIEADSVRYAPPERLDGNIEDPSADTYSLAVVAYEVMTGRALFVGHDVEAIKKQIQLSEATTFLSKPRQAGLPSAVSHLLARAMVFDPDSRLSGQELVDEVAELLGSSEVEGPGLAEQLARIEGHRTSEAPKGKKLVSTKATGMFTPAELQKIAAEEDDDEGDEDENQEPESRWGKVSRGNDAAEPAAPKQRKRRSKASTETPAAEKPSRRSRRRSQQEPDEAPEPTGRRRRRSASTPEEPAAPSPRRRRRRSDAPDKPEKAAKTEKDEPAPRRRRRRSSAPESEELAEATKVSNDKPAEDAKKEPEDKAKPKEMPSPRRRRRRGSEADETPSEVEEPASEEPRRRRRRSASSTEDPAPSPRRRRRTAEATPQEAEVEPEATENEEPKEEAPTPEEPKPAQEPRRRRRRSEASAEASEATKPSPRRRRRSKPAEESEAEEPAPRSRRRRRTTGDAEPEQEASAETSPRRRRRRKPAEESPAKEDSAEDSDEDPPTPRRRRRRRS